MDMPTLTWPDWTHLTWSGPKVKVTLPPASLFQFPPANFPSVLTPPLNDRSLAQPFTIPVNLYNALLSPSIPITFALVYVSAITILNGVNRRREYKPWAISRTRLFKLFVLAHNAFLTVYSLWTFIGMFNAMRMSVERPRGAYGLAGTVDSLCKLNGPRGLGSSATFNSTTGSWGITDRKYHLDKDTNLPDSTDVGRIWNSGLAFYGWLFYLSKFYEVFDTLIIIAKGKKSSFLQTYHHAGAMLSMWAGIRYMSPPIWIFVLFNSFVHTIMYTFYFATALGIRIPKPIKQTLTTMQIAQFVVGIILAFAYLFLAYQAPISTAYVYHLGDAIRSMASSVSADASSVISTATAAASAGTGSWLKKLALRAAGREGLAENVENEFGQTFGVDAVHAVKDFRKREETRYRDELRWTHCIDTSGQTFAICLNIFYLLPLTVLFGQFFIKSYLKRVDGRRRSSLGDRAVIATQSFNDASKGVSRRLSEAYEDYQGANGDDDDDVVLVDGDEIRKEMRKLGEQTKSAGNEAVKQGKDLSKSVSDKVSEIDPESIQEDVKAGYAKAKHVAKSKADQVGDFVSKNQPSEETKKKAADAAKKAKDTTANVASKAQQVASDAASKTKQVYDDATSEESKQKVKESVDNVAANVKSSADKAAGKASEVKKEVQKNAEQVSKVASEKAPVVKKEAQKAAEKTSKKAGEVKDEVAEKIPDNKEQWEEVGKKAKKKAGQAKDVASQKAQETAEITKDKASELEDTASKKGQQAKQEAGKKAEEGKSSAKGVAPEAKSSTKETKSSDSTNTSAAIDKKEQDKIIDQSQIVREKEVDSKAGSKTGSKKPSESQSGSESTSGGFSYAAAAAEGVSEDDKGEHVVIDEKGESHSI